MTMILEIYIAVFAHTVSTKEVSTAGRGKNPLKQLTLNQSFPTLIPALYTVHLNSFGNFPTLTFQSFLKSLFVQLPC